MATQRCASVGQHTSHHSPLARGKDCIILSILSAACSIASTVSDASCACHGAFCEGFTTAEAISHTHHHSIPGLQAGSTASNGCILLQGARNEIFALQPAPVQASYMGFPATMGASFLPYLITDKAVAPESCRACYSENLALMPNCYFVNDYKHAHMVRTAQSPTARTTRHTQPQWAKRRRSLAGHGTPGR